LKGIEMKQQKHHLVNWKEGKTNCGINFKKDSIRIAELDNGKWYNDYGDELNTIDNWESIFCMSCLKLHELDLINQFKMQSFLIQYELAIPKSIRLKKAKKIKARRNRITGVKVNSITDQLIKDEKQKANPIPKSTKGIERDKKKANPIKKPTKPYSKHTIKKSNPIEPTDDKCKIISKPDKPIEKPIELVDEVKKPLIDLSNGPVTIETEPIEEWAIGDPIDDDIFELVIGNDWKLVRHDKQLDKWQFVSKQVVKGKPDWITDSEFISYSDASELINDGYCE